MTEQAQDKAALESARVLGALEGTMVIGVIDLEIALETSGNKNDGALAVLCKHFRHNYATLAARGQDQIRKLNEVKP